MKESNSGRAREQPSNGAEPAQFAAAGVHFRRERETTTGPPNDQNRTRASLHPRVALLFTARSTTRGDPRSPPRRDEREESAGLDVAVAADGGASPRRASGASGGLAAPSAPPESWLEVWTPPRSATEEVASAAAAAAARADAASSAGASGDAVVAAELGAWRAVCASRRALRGARFERQDTIRVARAALAIADPHAGGDGLLVATEFSLAVSRTVAFAFRLHETQQLEYVSFDAITKHQPTIVC